MNFAHIEKILELNKTAVSVCMPEEEETFLALHEADKSGYLESFCVGNVDKMKAIIERHAPGFRPKLIDAVSPEEAAFKSVELIRKGDTQALMKGNISTPVFLKAVLNSETGIKKGQVLSHIFVFEWQGAFRFITDGGLIPHPTIEEKQGIIQNVLDIARRLGVASPKIAVLSAIEKVNFKIPSSVDAAILSKMGERGQFGDCKVEGPLALDNAVSLESAHHKGLFNDVVGRADILVVPDIDTGNILGKTVIYYTNFPSGGLIAGATHPIIMLSRSDNSKTRLNSIRLALAAGN